MKEILRPFVPSDNLRGIKQHRREGKAQQQQQDSSNTTTRSTKAHTPLQTRKKRDDDCRRENIDRSAYSHFFLIFGSDSAGSRSPR